MNTYQKLANDYLKYLQEDDLEGIVSLFSEDGLVVSPLYGQQDARSFYESLSQDTQASRLTFDGLFIEENKKRLALLFDYHWLMQNGNEVTFKVVDIIDLDESDKIKKLTIIYDAGQARERLNV